MLIRIYIWCCVNDGYIQLTAPALLFGVIADPGKFIIFNTMPQFSHYQISSPHMVIFARL